MTARNMLWAAVCLLGLASPSYAAGKTKLFIVSSYHREYLWDQDLNEGTLKALLELGYLDNQQQADEFTKNDSVESSKAVIKKAWLDTKRKTKPAEMQESADAAAKEIDKFKPDLLMISDDNGTRLLGQRYKDQKLPIVFSGVDETPLKYGLVDALDKPGHNVTGVYQRGFYKEAAEALVKLVPGVKTFAIISDDSESGMFKVKGIQEVAAKGDLPIQLVEVVHTNSFDDWKAQILALSKKVDAFLVVNHNTLKDAKGQPVDQMQAGSWYLQNVKKPDFSSEKQFVQEGILVVAEDSAFKQGYEMVRMGTRVLRRGEKPASIAPVRPNHGPIIVNKARAKMLGISVDGHPVVEKVVESSIALEKFPKG